MVFETVVLLVFLLASPFIFLSSLLIVMAFFRSKTIRTPSNLLILSLSCGDAGFGICVLVSAVIYFQSSTWPSSSSSSSSSSWTTCSTNFTTLQNNSVEKSKDSAHWFILDESTSASPFLPSPPSPEHPLPPPPPPPPPTNWIGPILITFLGVSILSVALISMDRFFSVAQPLRYNQFVTTAQVQRILFLTWTLAFSVGLISLQQQSDVDGTWMSWLILLLFLPTFAVLLFCYGYIYVVARSHIHAITKIYYSCHNSLTEGESIHHHRYGLTLALILALFLFSFAPISTASLVDYLAGTCILKKGELRAALTFPILFNSFFNPWIYGYRSSEIRLAVIRLLDTILTRLTGRPGFSMRILGVKSMGGGSRGEFISCASNVRLLAMSPTQTTVQCCQDRNHLSILLCDQTSL